MRAAVTNKLGEPLTIDTLPDPTPGPGELVLSVEACGICGSDLHIVDAMEVPGTVLGHEFCGEVVALGAGVEGWKVGDRAAGLSLATCGECAACRAGLVRKCERALMLGVELPGGFAQLTKLPAHDAIRLPVQFDPRAGALVEPLAVARHSVERAGDVEGERTLVLGGGPVGLAVALWLQQLGAATVAVSDPMAGRRATATGIGVDFTIDPGTEDVASRFAAEAGGPPSVVLECVGVPGLIGQAADVAAVDGRVVVVGVCLVNDTLFPYTSLSKELDLRFAFYYRRQDFEETIAAIDDGRLDPFSLVTDQVGFDEVSDKFESLKNPSGDTKVLLLPN